MDIEKVISYWINKAASLGGNLFDAAMTFIIGYIICRVLLKVVVKMLKRSTIDEIIVDFLKMALDIALKIILVIMTASSLGLNTTSLIAVLTTCGAAVVLGLQDSASGIVSGITLLLSKPFSKGDLIEVNGYTGKVLEIEMLYTILMTLDNKRVIIPNNELAGDVIINYSFEDVRRVDFNIEVDYAANILEVKDLINDVIAKHPMAMNEPEPYVRVDEYKDSSVSVVVRVWCKTDDYFALRADLLEEIKIILDKNDISMAYPQLDVHIKDIKKGETYENS